MDELAFLDATAQADLVRRKQVKPIELVDAAIERIERLNPAINAVVTPMYDIAREAASGPLPDGPFSGVPFLLKDLSCAYAGTRLTSGSAFLKDYVPGYDSELVARYKRAGLVTVGKTNTPEFGLIPTTESVLLGPARNPWDTGRTTGGSSGGSAAAVSADMCQFSLGSDTGGSIRIPAAFCGVVGLKPTFGRVSRHGVFPLGFSLDHIGPFALTVEDAAFIYQTIAGADSRDDSIVDRPVDAAVLLPGARLGGKKIGVPRNFYFEKLHPDVEAATRKALTVFEQLGASLVDIEVPNMDEYNAVARLILLAEASSVHVRRLQERREDFGEDVRALFDQGRFILATDYLNAQRQRRTLAEKFRDLLTQVDAIVTPAVSLPAPKIGQKTLQVDGEDLEVRMAVTRIPRALNLTGLPLLTLPCGFSADGLPIGLQIIGAAFDEKQILEIGHAYEQATEWHKRKPPVLA